MTKKGDPSSKFDEVYKYIIEMEKKRIEEENQRDIDYYTKTNKRYDCYIHNSFESYGYETRPENINC
jgi:hypothetical protein